MRKLPLAVVATVAVMSAAAGTAPALGVGRPDLAGSAASVPRVLSELNAATIVVRVRNLGRAAARTPGVVVLLSKNRRRDRADHVIGSESSRRRLAARRSASVRVTVLGMSPLRPGTYYVLACASTGKQRQTSVANDCSANPRRVRLQAARATLVPKLVTRQGAAQARLIDAAGGSVDIALPDGSRAALKIPAKALAVATIVRLVPVVSISPAPPRLKPRAGVLIEPEGLGVPGATVTLTPAAGVKRKGLRALAFGGEDEAIVGAPFLPRSGLTVDARIFGGYGLATATSSARSARVASSAACRRAAAAAVAAAVNPCAAESLRKRLDQMFAGTDFSDRANVESSFAAADQLVTSEVDPAIEQAVRDGAQAEELDPLISIELGLERQKALLAIPDNSAAELQKLAGLLGRFAENSIKACETRKQGPVTTAVAVVKLERQAQLMSRALPGVESAFAARCASKPWHMTYDLTTHETPQSFSGYSPIAFTGGTAHIAGLAVPSPDLFQPGAIGRGPLEFSALTCSPGSTVFTGCTVSAATGDFEAQGIESLGSTKKVTRCGRVINVVAYLVRFQLGTPNDKQTLHLTLPTPLPPQSVPTSGHFARALRVVTENGSEQVVLPDNGGSLPLSGATSNFSGTGTAVDATGAVTLTLK